MTNDKKMLRRVSRNIKCEVILGIIFAFIGLSACGSINGGKGEILDEESIMVDLENEDIFESKNLSITDLEIVKRQTNIEDKEDFVFVHVEGENDAVKAIKHYKLTYILYNEGWLFEDMEPFQHKGCNDEIVETKRGDSPQASYAIAFESSSAVCKDELFYCDYRDDSSICKVDSDGKKV